MALMARSKNRKREPTGEKTYISRLVLQPSIVTPGLVMCTTGGERCCSMLARSASNHNIMRLIRQLSDETHTHILRFVRACIRARGMTEPAVEGSQSEPPMHLGEYGHNRKSQRMLERGIAGGYSINYYVNCWFQN
eukprot:3248464-Amphidinium_carterae.1